MAKAPESLDLSTYDATDKSLDRDCTTLSRHVLQQLQSFSPDAQDLSALMNRIALAGKLVARRMSRAGLMEGVLGFTGEVNVQGESVKKMDVYANDVFISVFKQSGLVCRLASDSDGKATDLLTNGRKQLAAGYILYGPCTMLVYTIGKGVHSFVLDPSLGEFILTEENIRIPTHGSVYSVNEGNFWQWEESIREYIRYVHRTEGYSARYSGAMVSDIHRILVQGGVFLYPGTIQNPEGKLRLLYETAPLAFLIEQAGGRATTGLVNILDVVPKKLHQRTPLIIGSKEDVAKVESFIQNGH